MVMEMAGMGAKQKSHGDIDIGNEMTPMIMTKELEEKKDRVLQCARQLYQYVVEPNSFNVGRKPLAIVAAVVELALEVEDERENARELEDQLNSNMERSREIESDKQDEIDSLRTEIESLQDQITTI